MAALILTNHIPLPLWLYHKVTVTQGRPPPKDWSNLQLILCLGFDSVLQGHKRNNDANKIIKLNSICATYVVQK